MNHPSFKLSLLAATLFLLAGCSDVPLSWSTTLSDKRLLGFWQVSDDEIFQIRKNDDGKIYMVNYDYDKTRKIFVQAAAPSIIYFTTLSDKDLSCQFISIETSYQETKCYLSSWFYFAENGDLVTQGINTEILDSNINANKDAMLVMGTAEKYAEAVKKNLRTPEFFETPQTVKRIAGFPKRK